MEFPDVETSFLISGPAGNLEILTSPAHDNSTQSDNAQQTGHIAPKAIAIICHPHPLYGGTMNNKVVTALAWTFKDLGMPSVRFNFRGVGKSEGVFDNGIGELDDLLAVIRWVNEVRPGHALWLAGFSFGGYIAARAATSVPAALLITVAPQVSRFTAAPFPAITVPWILAQGDEDEVVSAQEVFAWIETLEHKPIVVRIPNAGHFFHGKLIELREKLTYAIRGLG